MITKAANDQNRQSKLADNTIFCQRPNGKSMPSLIIKWLALKVYIIDNNTGMAGVIDNPMTRHTLMILMGRFTVADDKNMITPVNGRNKALAKKKVVKPGYLPTGETEK